MSTLLHRLTNWADSDPHAPAQRYKLGGKWQPVTSSQMRDRVFYLACYLESKGFGAGDVSCIYSYNCPEWVQTELASTLLGGVSSGLYPNSSPKDLVYSINLIKPKLFVVQDKKYFEQLQSGVSEKKNLLDDISLFLCFDRDCSFLDKAVWIEDAIEEGREIAKDKQIESYLDRLDPNAGAFIIFTSGTTGDPKAALLSQDNLVFAANLVMKRLDLKRGHGSMFSFLPLCHVAEKLQNLGAGITGRFTVNFCSGFENVVKELPECSPSLLLCVPRVWEKVKEGVQSKVAASEGGKKKLAMRAFEVGARVIEGRLSEKTVSVTDQLEYALYDRLVFSKIRKALGMDRIDAAGSGAALLAANVEKWFRVIGVEIINVYGQTESSGLITAGIPGVPSTGTVGKTAPETELKLAEDGEILSKGRHIFVGYLHNEEAYRSTVIDGWLHTGDLGKLDEKGNLQIVGRKKEIIKTSGGKMIAPVPIEEKLQSNSIISQACMVGEGRKYLSALIALTPEHLQEYKDSVKKGELLEENIRSQVQKIVDGVNSELASYQQVKKFALISEELSIDGGELTPTMKVKRRVVESKYSHLIEGFYS